MKHINTQSSLSCHHHHRPLWYTWKCFAVMCTQNVHLLVTGNVRRNRMLLKVLSHILKCSHIPLPSLLTLSLRRFLQFLELPNRFYPYRTTESWWKKIGCNVMVMCECLFSLSSFLKAIRNCPPFLSLFTQTFYCIC